MKTTATTATTETTIHRGARWSDAKYGHHWWSASEDHASHWGQVRTATLPAGLTAITVTLADLEERFGSHRGGAGQDGLELASLLEEHGADVALLPGWESELDFYVADHTLLQGLEDVEEIDTEELDELAQMLSYADWADAEYQGMTIEKLRAEAEEMQSIRYY